MTTDDPPALVVDDVSIQFGGIQALTDVSFTVPRAGFTAVIGPNGAGKTTLFNCVSGFYRGSGTIHANGVRVDTLPSSKRPGLGVARTFQTPSLIDDATVLHNIMLGRYSRSRSGVLSSLFGLPLSRREERDARQHAVQLAAQLGLADLVDAQARRLPHRQRRLVEIARGLASDPQLLLLDEPAAGSHHSEAVAMLALVRDLCAERGIAVVLVEHNVRLVMEFARDVVVLNFGSILAQGGPADIQRNPEVIKAYLGEVAV